MASIPGSTRAALLAAALFATSAQAALLGRKIDTTIYSPSLQKARQVLVYLPKEAATEPTRKFPAILFLHGANSTPLDYSSVIDAADAMMAAGHLDPSILVLPDASNPPWGGSFYTNSVLNGRYEDFVIQDVIAAAESLYAVQKGVWAATGHSMGGFGAMKLTMQHPHLFRAAASLSGPLDLDHARDLRDAILQEQGGPKPVYSPTAGKISGLAFTMSAAFSPNLASPTYVDFPVDANGSSDTAVLRRWMTHSPSALARGVKDRLPPLYFDCGTQDMLGVYPFNTGFRDSLDAAGITYRFEAFEGGHSDKLGERVPIALRFLDSVLHATPTTSLGRISGDRSGTLVRRRMASLEIVAPSGGSGESWSVALHDLQGRLRARGPAALEEGASWTLPAALPGAIYVVQLTATSSARRISQRIDLLR